MLASRQRGDTIIEVILGLAILGLVTVSMFAIMQRGAANAYDALERSQARQLLNTQAELLNYVRDSYAASKAIGVIPADNSPGKVWQKITDQSPTAVVKNTQSIALPTLSTCAPTADDTDFYLTKSAGVIGMETDFTAATGAPTPGKASGFSEPIRRALRHLVTFMIFISWHVGAQQCLIPRPYPRS